MWLCWWIECFWHRRSMARILTSAKIYLPLEHLKRKKDKNKQKRPGMAHLKKSFQQSTFVIKGSDQSNFTCVSPNALFNSLALVVDCARLNGLLLCLVLQTWVQIPALQYLILLSRSGPRRYPQRLWGIWQNHFLRIGPMSSLWSPQGLLLHRICHRTGLI